MNLHHTRLVATLWLGLANACMVSVARAQGASTPAPRPAQALINDGLATATTEHKTVLVEFGASWCGWCKKFNTFLHSPEVGKIMLDNYVVVSLTAQESADKLALENPGADSLLKAIKGEGLPFFFFLDASGKKLGDSNVEPGGGNIGHPDTPAEIDAFDHLLEKTAPRMSAAQRLQIHQYLTKTAAEK